MLQAENVRFISGVATRALTVVLLTILLVQPAFAGQDRLKWSVETGGGIKSSPAVGKEGIIYVGSNDDKLWAIEPDGTVKWMIDLESDIRRAVVLSPDDIIYVATQGRGVFAFNPDGTPAAGWETPFDPQPGQAVNGDMALAADGTLYVSIGGTVDTAMIYALNPDKSVFWSFEPGTGVRGIAIGPGGVVVLSQNNGRIVVLDSFGTLIWDRDDTNGIQGPVIFADDGSIIVASDSELIMYDLETGDIKWEVDSRAGDSPSTAVNGDIYVPLDLGASSGGVACIDPTDGSEKWRFLVGARVTSTPLVDFNGTVIFGSWDDSVYAINPPGVGATPQGGGASLFWSFETGGNLESSSPNIAENGTLYIGSDDSMLYALNTDAPGLAASSSPKRQRDMANTGQFGSDRTRRRFFAPQVYWLSDESNAIVIVRHTGGVAGNPTGTTAEFRIDVLDRDGSVRFSIEESVEPGEIKRIVLKDPTDALYAGAAVIDAPVKDGSFLAPFLLWKLDVSAQFEPLDIGAAFEDPTSAARVHHAPAEASESKNLGIAVMNIGENTIPCSLTFLTEAGVEETTLQLSLEPKGSLVRFFNDDLPPEGFLGSVTLSCQDPVVAVVVVQDRSNGEFPSDFVTAKGLN